jgi:hypothetical protein
MNTKNKTNIIEVCNKLSQRINDFELNLKNDIVIMETEGYLFKELEETAHTLNILSEEAENSDDFTKALLSKDLHSLKERIQSLFGQVHDLAVDGEFHLLKTEALVLGKTLAKNKEQEEIEERQDELDHHLKDLKRNYRSSLKNQLIQIITEKFLTKMSGIKQGTDLCNVTISELENAMKKICEEEDPSLTPEVIDQLAGFFEEAERRYGKNPWQMRQYIENAIKQTFIYDSELIETLQSIAAGILNEEAFSVQSV